MKSFNGTVLQKMQNFSTPEGDRFKKDHPLAHNLAVFAFIVLFLGGIMGAAYVVSSKLTYTPSPVSPSHDARDARLYAISFGQMALEETLKSPESVQYKLKAYNLSNDALCYSYSALNGFGGRAFGVHVIHNGKAYSTARAFAQYCAEGSDFEKY